VGRYGSQRGVALILLIGITATLAIIALMIATVLVNQVKATDNQRSRQQSFDYADGALDHAASLVKGAGVFPEDAASTSWLPDIASAFAGLFPADAHLDGFWVYDNSGHPPDRTVCWDANHDHEMWVEVQVTYHGKTTRSRCLVSQLTENVVKSFPKAAVYSDTGIKLDGTSDVYAVKSDGVTPYVPLTDGGSATAWATTIMCGGSWTSGMPAGTKNFVSNSSANLAAPGSATQSVNVECNGSLVPNGAPAYQGTLDGAHGAKVGLLSDYFDGGAQADLCQEAQSGQNHTSAPTAPAAPTAPGAITAPTSSGTSVAPSKFTQSAMTTVAGVTYTSATKTYTFANDIIITGNLELKSGTGTGQGVFPAGTSFVFKKVYVNSSYYFKVTDTINMSATSLYVGGPLTVNNTTATATTDAITGTLYVNSTSTSSVAGRATLTAAAFYAAGPVTFTNTSTTIPQVRGNNTVGISGTVFTASTFLYAGGALSISAGTTNAGQVYGANTVALSGTATVVLTGSLYSSGALTISNPATTCDSVYANSSASFTGNAAVTINSLYVHGTLTVSGATFATADRFGTVYLAGSGNAVSGAVTSACTSWFYTAGTLTMSNTVTSAGLIYAAADLTFSGNITVDTLGLVVDDGDSGSLNTDLTISGATTPVVDQFGSIYVEGTATWSGTASVTTTNYLNASAKPGPMYITILRRSGTYNDVYGDTWLVGDAGTSDVAWSVIGPTSGTACSIMCPLLGTTEKTEISGKVNFGNMTNPMVYYMMCDNDSLYSNTMLLGNDGYDHNDDGSLGGSGTAAPYSGTFYGLIVGMEACMRIYSTNAAVPCVVGAVFNGTEYINGTTESQYDVELNGAASVAYCQAIIDAVTDTAITTTTRVTQIVPGSWQQLPVHD
jgi:Tfp pilus assembly protein PilX